ncbi:MAG TPA: hypothetical protein VKV74_17015 [Bryobacteraceae bacterium]|nr:hypothetical protein [Bryobacteraceae bacterium]
MRLKIMQDRAATEEYWMRERSRGGSRRSAGWKDLLIPPTCGND